MGVDQVEVKDQAMDQPTVSHKTEQRPYCLHHIDVFPTEDDGWYTVLTTVFIQRAAQFYFGPCVIRQVIVVRLIEVQLIVKESLQRSRQSSLSRMRAKNLVSP